MNNYLTLALKYFIKQKKTAIVTILSIVVGTMIICSAIICVYTIVKGQSKEIDLYSDKELFTEVVVVVGIITLLIYIAMVIIRNIFSINVIERVKDFAVLKSIGADNGQLYRLFVIESLLSGSIGVPIGIIFSYVAMDKVFDVLIKESGLSNLYRVRVSAFVVIITVIILIFTLMLAVIEPFLIMKKTSILQAVNRNYAITNKKIKRIHSGVFSIFGIEGEYAYKNARRNTKAFMTVVTSFVIAIVVYIAFEGVINSYFKHLLKDNNNYYDASVYINSNNNTLTNEESKKIMKQLEDSGCFEAVEMNKELLLVNLDMDVKIEEKQEEVNPLFLRLVIYNKEQIDFMRDSIIEGSDNYNEINKKGAILLVSEKMQENYPINLSIGDKLKVPSSRWLFDELANNTYGISDIAVKLAEENGMEYTRIKECVPLFRDKCDTKSINITSIAKTNEEIGKNVYIIMTQEYFDNTVGKNLFDGSRNIFNVKTNLDSTLLDINTFFYEMEKEACIMFYDDDWEYYREIKQVRKKLNYVILVIGAVGVFFVINSLTNEQIRRKREFAILRAVGMDKFHMIKMILLEKGLMCIIAFIVGSILGNTISYAWVRQIDVMSDDKITYIFPYKAMFIAFAVMLMISVMSSIVPIVTMHKTKMDFNNVD